MMVDVFNRMLRTQLIEQWEFVSFPRTKDISSVDECLAVEFSKPDLTTSFFCYQVLNC